MISIPNYSRAFSLSDIFTSGESFISKGKSGGTASAAENETFITILPIAQALVQIGSLVIAVATVIIAIKYLMGTPEKKAELKSELVGLIVSTVVIYGAQAIWALMYEILNKL